MRFDELQDIYRHNDGGRGECPDSDVLWQLANRQLGRSARETVASHLTACFDCADEYLLIRRAEASPEPRTNWLQSLRMALAVPRPALAAVAVFLSVGVMVVVQSRTAQPTSVRGASPVAEVAGTLPVSGSIVTVLPEALSFPGVDGAAGYRVALYDAESTELFRWSNLEEPRAPLSAELTAELSPGTYYWRFSVDDGTSWIDSPLVDFQYRP